MQSNDLCNGKWLLRRALYLTWIGRILQSQTHLVSSVSWTEHCGLPFRPLLQVDSKIKVLHNAHNFIWVSFILLILFLIQLGNCVRKAREKLENKYFPCTHTELF